MSSYLKNASGLGNESTDKVKQDIPKPKNEPTNFHDSVEQEAHIEWSNLIFLPFHPVFQLLVLISAIVKTILGPLQSVYALVNCRNEMEYNIFIDILFDFYWYIGDTIYGIDTLLHIIHRQVTDKAMRREYMPKSAFLLLLDILSLIPFFRLVVEEVCSPPPQLWPNLLAYNEFLVVYRIWEYFNLASTHSYTNIFFGFTIFTAITINCLTAFWVLLTYRGLCASCSLMVLDYDWRAYVRHKDSVPKGSQSWMSSGLLIYSEIVYYTPFIPKCIKYKINDTKPEFLTFVYAASLVTSHGLRTDLDNILPSTILEFIMICLFMIAGYSVINIFVIPKAFAESILKLNRGCYNYPAVKKILEETKKRNPSREAYQHVQTYYSTMWKMRSGIVHMPSIMDEIPTYLRIEIKQDLFWPLFYHSPTLRRRSNAFKSWLCESVRLSYKLPGEKFFTGSQCLTSLFYVKSGVVQLISADDGTTPILSVTGGTIFGDISFLLPHTRRKVHVRCLTYCEVFFLTRHDLLTSMRKFPDDRKEILNAFRSKIVHAKKLFACKEQTRGLDRNEDESIAWIKRRWWEIFDVVSAWKKAFVQGEHEQSATKCEIPPEKTRYHCAKYLGQLVLCTDAQLRTKSMFVNYRFPWILSPYSVFVSVWKKIVIFTVFIALCLYPPYIVTENGWPWIEFVLFWLDIVYAADLCVSLSTALRIEENETPQFVSVMLERCKSINFILDILSTIWIEDIMIDISLPSLYYSIQFNRLIKIYILFSPHFIKCDIMKNPMIAVFRRIILIHFAFLIISSHLVYELCSYYPEVTISYFFGSKMCTKHVKTDCEPVDPIFGVLIPWLFELLFPTSLPLNQMDIYISLVTGYLAYIIYAFCKGRFLAYIYLKYRDIINYEYFVNNLKMYYNNYGLHNYLSKRLDKYLICHYQYNKGINIMDQDVFKNEPFEIYWKVQGEVAHKIISESKPFKYADPALTKELACASKFIIIPRNATLFSFGSQFKNVTWAIKGYIKSEFIDANGEVVTKYYESGDMLSASYVLFGKCALKNYISCTECELLCIKTQDFFRIYKSHLLEWQFLESIIKENETIIEEVYQKQVAYYNDYKYKLQDRTSQTLDGIELKANIQGFHNSHLSPIEGNIRREPESKFMRRWLLFRTITVIISITNASLKGGIGATAMRYFQIVESFCDCIAWIDIILKLLLYYYDSRGLLITDNMKCLKNYITKGFLMDILGVLPWYEVVKALLSKSIDSNNALLINTFCKFAHIYIVLAYFDYISDRPSVNVRYRMIKWQVVNLLIVMGASHYLISHCVDYNFDETMNVNEILLRNECWVPKMFTLPKKLDNNALHFLFIQSLNLVECGLMLMNQGGFVINRQTYGVFVVLFLLGVIFWVVTCYTLTLLVLGYRENTLFQHGVNSLKVFLENERIEKETINKAVEHFRYCWKRTKNINIQQITNERIGVVFRQDLSYFFYKQTFTVLNTLLKGEEGMQMLLASASSILYFLPGHEIMREMDLVQHVYVVHRGRVVLKKNNMKIMTLTKGDIFGQLVGTRLRPVKISALADDHVDVLQISVKQFQEIITNEVRETIALNYQSKNDFLATNTWYVDDPYDTIEYILRGKKAIKLPWMRASCKAHHRSWYARWLYLTWFFGPCITAFFVIIMYWSALPPKYIDTIYIILILMDILHLCHLISGFYTTDLTIENNKCVERIIGFGILREWGYYADVVSLTIPLLTLVTNNPIFQSARLLRIKWFYDFSHQFCKGFKSKTAPMILRAAVIILYVHMLTAGWIYVACEQPFPFTLPEFNETQIDFNQWTHPNHREGGCARTTRITVNVGDAVMPTFAVPVHWPNDYIVAMTYIVLIHTHTNMDTVIALSTLQVYFKVLVTYSMYFLDIWLMAIAISAIYTRLRDQYQYDNNVLNLKTFLKDSGLGSSLSNIVQEYTEQLWRKHRGNWLPELAFQGPVCLREDLFVALYIHHLNTPSTFRQLPYYFKRQLAARLERTVIFPGKCIVHEGDAFNVTYFIHEGEVEKRYEVGGENRTVALLYTNGYFGSMPGLFETSAFQFSYYTRTVVDLVYLKRNNWLDLLEGYPDIKKTLYESTRALKQDGVRVTHGPTNQK